MSVAPCKSCGFTHGRLGAKRLESYARVLSALDAWQRSASLGTVGRPPEAAVSNVRSNIVMLIADEQGLCVACLDRVVLPAVQP